ncbi:hypothetical protein OF376_01390 [Ureaplasma miroungigenitalium]|uniref:Transmembrane protein n=1 Tax=Ureaplasma miroungigenitalium TaxID=1042321 RepID=A0ABT3BMG6_9BACT|nr:hypothetical protein [Ureaplasma miroungigenitalium]MCV3728419.1 hypothetical protein [Ureaplasma miroungigenitalium]
MPNTKPNIMMNEASNTQPNDANDNILSRLQRIEEENMCLKMQNQQLALQSIPSNPITPITPVEITPAVYKSNTNKDIHPTEAFVIDVSQNTKTPDFYEKEKYSSLWKLSFWVFLMGLIVGVIAYFIYKVVEENFTPWIFLPFLMMFVVCFCMTLSVSSDYRNFKREGKNLSQSLDACNTSNFILKIYKKLVTAPIIINWISASLYLVLGFCILFTFLLTYLINLINNGAIHLNEISFGDLRIIKDPVNLNNPQNVKTPLYAVISFGTLLCFVFVTHLMMITSAKIRLDRMNVYYTQPIITNEDELKLKQSAFKKGLIVFCILLVIIGIILLVIYLVAFKHKKNRSLIKEEVLSRG